MNRLIHENVSLTLRSSNDCTSINKITNHKLMYCLNVKLKTDCKLYEEIKEIADIIKPKLNPNGANTSEERSKTEIDIDNLGGLIAEKVCKVILEMRYGKEKVLQEISTTSKNQIDITLDGKTIEVRSSFTFIPFDNALFGKSKSIPNKYSYHIIGPYKNGYKPNEPQKDYYISVLFITKKEDFLNAIEKGIVELCIVGGATWEMFDNEKIYRITTMEDTSKKTQQKSEYRAIPFEFGLDILEFFAQLEANNPTLALSPYCLTHSPYEKELLMTKDKVYNSFCRDCCQEMKKDELSFSVNKFGVPLCRTCQYKRNKNK